MLLTRVSNILYPCCTQKPTKSRVWTVRVNHEDNRFVSNEHKYIREVIDWGASQCVLIHGLRVLVRGLFIHLFQNLFFIFLIS